MTGLRPITLAAGLCLALAAPVRAQNEPSQLFERVNLTLEASYLLNLTTVVRLDSEELGVGTTINFEGDLNLDTSKTIPSFSAELLIGKRHLIGGSWFKVDRSSTSQLLTMIQFGDLEIPVDQAVTLATDQEELRLWYRFFPVVTRSSAFGVGLGVRRVDYHFLLEAPVLLLRERAIVGVPLPFVGAQLRQMVAPKLRFTGEFDWFALRIQTVDGSQYTLGATLEHLTFSNASFGVRVRVSSIEASVNDQPRFAGTADIDGTRASAFARIRW